jgi:hypothetical protein
MTFFWLGKKGETTLDPDALELYGNILCTPTELAFFGLAKVAQQVVTGPLSTITNVPTRLVLTSLINALAAYGLIKNETT